MKKYEISVNDKSIFFECKSEYEAENESEALEKAFADAKNMYDGWTCVSDYVVSIDVIDVSMPDMIITVSAKESDAD